MNQERVKRGNLIILDNQESVSVRGGTAASFQTVWEMIKGAFDFLKEYRKEIWRGLKRGWNNF